MTSVPAYVLLAPETAPPEISAFDPFRAIVIIERPVSPAWQARISDWLVRSGCLYMMAWGENCSAWDDSVDIANLEQFDFGDIPKDRDVMTTWHTEQSLDEVFFFAKSHASHPVIDLQQTVLIHISTVCKELEFLQTYASVK